MYLGVFIHGFLLFHNSNSNFLCRADVFYYFNATKLLYTSYILHIFANLTLRTADMDTLSTISKKTRPARIRNLDIRQQHNIENIIKFVRERNKEWNNHVTQAEDHRIIKIIRHSNEQID